MAILSAVWQKLAGKNASATGAKTVANNLTAATPSARIGAHQGVPTNLIPDANKEPLPDQYLPLWQLLTQRQLIEVKVDGLTQSYQTLVLAIDVQRGLLWLDDLFPSQHLLEVGDHITLRHHRNGELLTFSSPILAWGSSYGAAGLAISLPEHSRYLPRRQFNRAQVESNMTVKIRPLGQDISYANLIDISSGGLRVSVAGNLLGQLRHGALMPLCELRLSDELNIRCAARVRSFRLLRAPYRNTQISLEFVDLPTERAQQLQQFINNLFYLQQPSSHRELRSA